MNQPKLTKEYLASFTAEHTEQSEDGIIYIANLINMVKLDLGIEPNTAFDVSGFKVALDDLGMICKRLPNGSVAIRGFAVKESSKQLRADAKKLALQHFSNFSESERKRSLRRNNPIAKKFYQSLSMEEANV